MFQSMDFGVRVELSPRSAVDSRILVTLGSQSHYLNGYASVSLSLQQE